MKDKILKITSILLPVLLVGLAIWCLLSKDQHFPWIGTMIKKSDGEVAYWLTTTIWFTTCGAGMTYCCRQFFGLWFKPG